MLAVAGARGRACGKADDLAPAPSQYPQPERKTVGANAGSSGVWVSDPRQIAQHYVCSWWFYLDTFSIGVSVRAARLPRACPRAAAVARFSARHTLPSSPVTYGVLRGLACAGL